MVPHAFQNIERGQWVVFLKKGSHGARFSGLVSKVEKGKVTLTITKEYTAHKCILPHARTPFLLPRPTLRA